MHINSHFAGGVIFASILNYFFGFTILEFSLIVLFSFFCDFDVIFSKFAKDHNHRLLITHSIIPSIILIIIGYILMWPVLIICGFSYSIHIIIDTIDWGTNFFYFQKKQIGFKFLISKDEFENLPKYLAKYKVPASFFDEKYYGNKICLSIEICLFILMIIFVIIYAFQFILINLLYLPFILFHLSRHFHLKKIEAS
ncbi:MAG: metal-dependent hydrolase [Candidatus Lokiarchaeia archaeon]